jgi:hypothetical protein
MWKNKLQIDAFISLSFEIIFERQNFTSTNFETRSVTKLTCRDCYSLRKLALLIEEKNKNKNWPSK